MSTKARKRVNAVMRGRVKATREFNAVLNRKPWDILPIIFTPRDREYVNWSNAAQSDPIGDCLSLAIREGNSVAIDYYRRLANRA